MRRATIFVAAVLCVLTASLALADDSVEMTVSPKVLNIDAFFNGATLTATGSVPADSDVILRFVGAACDLHMKERGKVFGIMWMNLDSLTFKGIPSVCLISSAVDLEALSSNPAQESGLKALRLSGIKDIATIESKGLDQATAFDELLKLKQSEGLYGEKVGNVVYGPAIDGKKSFKAEIPIPSRLSPASYAVDLAAISNGKIIAQAREPVSVNLVGFPAMLAGLAFGHSALYGVLATFIAILSGLAIGFVFQSKGAH